tara:strand:+ start:197 stop:418 length:222 start_codon:yes stop_codon:yes gene_type:complete
MIALSSNNFKRKINMTRKDYIKIASVLKTANNNRDYYAIEDVFSILIDDMCEVLKADNSRFDKNKFINYIHGE